MRNTVISVFLLSVCSGVWAQPTPAQIQMQQHWQQQNMYGAIQSDNLKRCGDVHGHGCRQQRVPRGPSEAEIRAWERRERKVQERIAKYRATPYYGAIAFDFQNDGFGLTGGYADQQKAMQRAVRNCRSVGCSIVKVFSNTCAAIVSAYAPPRSEQDLFIEIDKQGTVAEQKAMQACEAVHGTRQDRCFRKSNQAYCSGYDYSVYGQK